MSAQWFLPLQCGCNLRQTFSREWYSNKHFIISSLCFFKPVFFQSSSSFTPLFSCCSYSEFHVNEVTKDIIAAAVCRDESVCFKAFSLIKTWCRCLQNRNKLRNSQNVRFCFREVWIWLISSQSVYFASTLSIEARLLPCPQWD